MPNGAASLGERLRIARGDSTREQAAADLGVNKATLGYYERDERDPPASLLAAVCRKYGVQPAWLLLGQDMPPPQLNAEPVPYDGEKMKLAMDIADALAEAGRLRRGVTKSDYATALYEFFTTAKGLPG